VAFFLVVILFSIYMERGGRAATIAGSRAWPPFPGLMSLHGLALGPGPTSRFKPPPGPQGIPNPGDLETTRPAAAEDKDDLLIKLSLADLLLRQERPRPPPGARALR